MPSPFPIIAPCSICFVYISNNLVSTGERFVGSSSPALALITLLDIAGVTSSWMYIVFNSFTLFCVSKRPLSIAPSKSVIILSVCTSVSVGLPLKNVDFLKTLFPSSLRPVTYNPFSLSLFILSI